LTEQNRLPNFFILGAGRCGTTSLAQHLRGHDQIFIPEIKEPSFFASSFQWVRDPGKYIDLYRDGHEAPARGDASHIYLEDPKSPEILEAFFPDARFVLMFRNPADRAVALYAMMLEHGYEVHRTFEKAFAAEDRRFESTKFRKTCPQSFWNFMYYRSGLFGEQVARYLERWPRDRFYATTLYDYLAEPEVVVGEILEFLGVDAAELGPVPRSASSKGTRSVPAQYLERRLLRPLERRKVPFVGEARRQVIAWNRGVDKPSMQADTRERMMELYRPDLAMLNDLLGVDIEKSELAARS
jgi:hypothetical protein